MNLLFLFFCLVVNPDRESGINNLPVAPADTTRVLIINCFDASKTQSRKNKKAIFAELADSLKEYLYDNLTPQAGEQIILYNDIVTDTSSGNIFKLMAEYKANACISIKNLDAFFDKTDVQSEKDDNGFKTIHVSYNIHSVVEYGLYNSLATVKTSRVDIYQFCKSKSSFSGFFTVGPNITSNTKAAFEVTRSNAIHFLNNDYADFRRM